MLKAKVTGSPTPDIKWFKGDKELVNDANHKIEHKPDGTVMLTIKDAQKEDAGDYRVEASNPLGVTWSDGVVALKGGLRLSLLVLFCGFVFVCGYCFLLSEFIIFQRVEMWNYSVGDRDGQLDRAGCSEMRW